MSAVSGKSPSLLKSMSPHEAVGHGAPPKTVRKSATSWVSGKIPSRLKSMGSHPAVTVTTIGAEVAKHTGVPAVTRTEYADADGDALVMVSVAVAAPDTLDRSACTPSDRFTPSRRHWYEET